jgi:hypothetical protein
MFGHSFQTPSNTQNPHYNSNEAQFNQPPNYPPTGMNYSNTSTNPTYANFNDHSHNAFSHQVPQNNPKNESPPNNGHHVENYSTSINIEKLSPKQLLCECIDLATSMLKEIVDTYTKNNDLKSPYEGRVILCLNKESNRLFSPGQLHPGPFTS